jgi:hypothetical protein
VSVAFTNGILSTQNLRKQLKTPDGKMPSKAIVKQRIRTLDDPLRKFLTGDVLPLMHKFIDKAKAVDGRSISHSTSSTMRNSSA